MIRSAIAAENAYDERISTVPSKILNSGKPFAPCPLADSCAPARSDSGRLFAWILCLLCVAFLPGCVTPTYYNVKDFTTVVIDAGHGGHDSGTSTTLGKWVTVRRVQRSRGGKRKVVVTKERVATGPRILEKDLALDVARRLQSKLRAAGLRTVMTRRDDTFIPLDGRVEISNAQRKSIFVAIHFNEGRRTGACGVETYHNNRGTPEFAGRIERAMASLPGEVNRGVKTANYRVLRKSRGPALLLECGFLSNPDEAARCATAAYREQIASRIAQAIIEQRQ
ncbi:MAG: N-acetylmuramoyl-L-alanine amidase [Verrucomicrobiota bacterium]